MYDSRPDGNLIIQPYVEKVIYRLFAKAGIPYMSVIIRARAATMRCACMGHTLIQQPGRLTFQACWQVSLRGAHYQAVLTCAQHPCSCCALCLQASWGQCWSWLRPEH